MERIVYGLGSLALSVAVSGCMMPLTPRHASQLVTVLAATGPCTFGGVALDIRELADATQQLPFAIPTGQVLVLTGGEITISATPNAVESAVLTLEDPSKGAIRVAQSYVKTDSTGFASLAFKFPNGIAAKSGRRFCLLLTSGSADASFHGFLARDK